MIEHWHSRVRQKVEGVEVVQVLLPVVATDHHHLILVRDRGRTIARLWLLAFHIHQVPLALLRKC